MSNFIEETHSNFLGIIGLKIPALRGKAADNNRKILEIISLNGPLLKYGVFKHLGGNTSTVSRRVDDLYERGYLSKVGTRLTKRGKQLEETQYGLTWKGLIASLAIQTVRKNIMQVLRKNQQLDIQERDFVFLVLNEIFSDEDFEIVATSFFIGFLKSTAPPLDDILDEDLKNWLIPAAREAPRSELKTTGTMNLLTLLDNPQILLYVKENFIPMIADYEKEFYEVYKLIKIFNDAAQFLATLTPEDKPSEKITEYLEEVLPDVEVGDEQMEEGQ